MAPAPGDLPAAWLRANCPCPLCRDPGSGQRLTGITDLPADVSIAEITMDQPDDAGGEARQVTVIFAPDGHRAVFDRQWLAQASAAAADPRTEDGKRLWCAADFAAGPPRADWAGYRESAACRERCLAAVLTDGFALLTGTPVEPGTVLAIAGSMGFVRETNYGRLFDVRVVADPANLAYTSLAISPHTDNPYRDPVPTVQLLHCLANSAEGGESALVDGFYAASLLRSESPAAFAVLTSTPVTFGNADKGAELTATWPMIGLDARGRIRQIRYNNRSLRPLPLEAGRDATAFYRAYRDFGEILLRPELALAFRLEPGDCLIFDNTRILHARTAFTASGGRHLQGCYADIDGIESSLAVLRRGM